MNIWALYIGLEFMYLAMLAIPLAVGCVCGLVTARKKIEWSAAMVFAPTMAVAGMFMFGVIADMVDAPHSDTTYIPMLVQSMARALGFLPAMVMVGVPVSTAGFAMSHFLCLRMGRSRHRR